MRITAERARELLCYDPDTGELARIGRSPNKGKCQGYHVIRLDGGVYGEHRIIWLMVTGKWPVGQIDHINGDRSDNRWANLREVSKAQNAQNRVKPNRRNKSGADGVHWFSRDAKWMARIYVNGKRRLIGLYPSLEDAIAARYAAEKKFLTHAPQRELT